MLDWERCVSAKLTRQSNDLQRSIIPNETKLAGMSSGAKQPRMVSQEIGSVLVLIMDKSNIDVFLQQNCRDY